MSAALPPTLFVALENLVKAAKAVNQEHFEAVVDGGHYLEGPHLKLGAALSELSRALYEFAESRDPE